MRGLTDDEFKELIKRMMSQIDFAEGLTDAERDFNATVKGCITIAVNVLREYQKMLTEKETD